jgi:MSHA pilin protein MshC
MLLVNTSTKHNKGFTLIELIVVIIIMGILSVTVLPNFFTSKGYEEYSYRGEVITKLRSIQLRAMQQSSAQAPCVALDNDHLGVPSVFLSSCTGAFSFDSDYGQNVDDTLEVKVDSNHQVVFSMDTGSVPFGFDKWGKPTTGCSGGCVIAIQGQDLLKIQIESEGYIHVL